MGADAARPPSPPSGPAGVTEGLSVAGAQPMGAATANSTLRYGLTVETPRSPSYDTTLLWRRDLAKRLRRRSRPTPIPARHPKAAVIDRTTEKRKSLQETTKEVNKPIIKAQSVRSHASSRTVIEAQLSQAELEASERLAEISRRELQLEADMVRKRLDARKLQIRANADSADEHESAGSVRNSNQDRLDEWLENSRDATSKPICKRLTDEPLSKYETPRRPAQAERHIRGLSPDRQGTAHIFAFLDDGSTLSMIDQDVADEIGAVGQDEPLCIRGIQRLKLSSVTQTVKAKVSPARGGLTYDISLKTVDGLGIRSQSLNKKRLLEYEHLADLGDECYTGMGVPQMLIGGDFSHLINPTEVRQGGEDEPCAVKTSLGWVFFGRMPRYVPNNEQVVMHCHSDDSDLVEQVKKHWAVEALGITAKDNIRPDDQRAIDTFERTVKKVGQRYEVGQLWAADDIKLPPSFNMAKARLRNLEARMSRDPDFANEYQAQIHKLLEKGYAERIMEPPQSDRMWFLPHFSVYNLNKGKYRAVFDCAAKSQGCALNDFILAGPDLLQSLLGILLRFREWEFAVTADIQEMFLQIQLRREDRHSQLFIWRGSRRDVTPWTYQLNRVCFGNISSPFLAHSVRNRNATDNKDRYPDAVYDIHNNHYMDDYVASYETERELISTATQVRLAHAEASFRLRSYASNSELLMRNIDPEERATGPSHLGEKQQTVLGMTWDPETDTLGYNTKMLRVPDDVKRYERSPTKRELLSAVMSVYDPLGLIAQYMISAKIIFQRVWTKGTDWDERLPAEEAEDFFRWLRALSDVSALRIPRRYATPTGAVRRELHIFSDASTEAYSAAAYWRVSNDEEETQVSLAIAKSRVCPLKVMTVPRLELTAAVVGVRLAETILREQRYPVTKVTYWTDSMVVLGWVRDDARNYRPYVSHRLAEIAEKTDRDAWRYVPTAQNPADRATRCQPAQSVRIEDEWYEGPRFLYGPETSWPSHTSNRTDDLPERKARPSTATSLAIISAKPDPSSVLPDVRRFSSYDRLLNATANVLLFIEKMRTKNKALQLQVAGGAGRSGRGLRAQPPALPAASPAPATRLVHKSPRPSLLAHATRLRALRAATTNFYHALRGATKAQAFDMQKSVTHY
ncbi:uncharacterized protein LOC125228007 [Leguminivora glycinivorella]|uniref:uncharacterized protein LOC125228007 n=1 Tax=Leguminivora glycinivorella TaxID=1035111 RepID=UPI00200DE2F0|nr:uncharacterized protein LOC125228007 [Leguminivora glycinivorella]